nr:transposase (putative), gypsy type [Tanacetum cinerariifolium]
MDSLKHWSNHFFWVDSFACPTSFPWHTGKNVSRETFPKSREFNSDGYAILVARPALFRKFSEPFLCLIRMSRNYTLDEDTYLTFLHDDGTGGCLPMYIVQLDTDPTKVKIGKRKRAEGEARLLDSTVGHVVSLLPIASACAKSKLDATVKKLFDEGGSADQVDFAAGGSQEAEVGIATGVRIVAEENVAAERPRRSRKKRASREAAIYGKSPSALRELLASSLLNVKVGVAALPTLPMVTSSVSATPKHESGTPAVSITRPNVRTIGASKRSDVVPLLMTEAVVAKLDVDLTKMACHLEEKFYPHMLTTISGQRWLLDHGLKLIIIKCLNSSKYLTALGAAISHSVEKWMQDGLAVGIDHGREGRNLTDCAIYNPSPDIEQLKVPIHIFEDQVVLGETSLSFALSVSHSRVEQIRVNIAAERDV